MHEDSPARNQDPSADPAVRRAARARLRRAVGRMSSSHDFAQVLQALHDGLNELRIDYHDCSINTVQQDGDRCVLSSNLLSGRREWEVQRATWGASTVLSIWRSGEPAYRPDLAAADPYDERRGHQGTFHAAIRCVVDVPFAFGTLAVNSCTPHAFGPMALAAIQELAEVLEDGIRRQRDLAALEVERATLQAEITQRQRAEDELQRRESLLHSLFRYSPMGIAVVDTRTQRFQDANQAFEAITGYTVAELRDMTVADITPAEDWEAEVGRIQAALQTPTPRYTLDKRYARRDGSCCWVRMVGGTLAAEGDAAPLAVACVMDISDERQTRQELHFQSLLLSQISDCITATDLDGNITYVNDSVCRLLGRPRAALVGASVRSYGQDPAAGATQDQIIATTRKAGSWRGEVVNYDAAGRRTVLFCRTQLLHDEAGRPAGMVGISTDLTQLRQAEIQRQESERRYRLLAENFPDGALLVFDSSRRCVFAEGRALGALGQGPQGPVGVTAEELCCDAGTSLAVRLAPVYGGQATRFEMTYQGRAYECLAAPLAGSAAHCGEVMVTAIDISARKEMEAELVRTQRLRAVGELAAGVSHNLNNILSSVLLPAQMLQMAAEDPRTGELAGEIAAAGRRAAELARRLHLASRGSGSEILGPVEIRPIVEQALDMTRPRWQDEPQARGLQLDVHVQLDGVPPIAGTSSQLHDLVVNLILNAVDAMPQGGDLTIRATAAGDCVRLVVQDTGTGMDKATRERIFTPFFTTKGEAGTGLGLATVHNTVRQWGGSIRVDTALGSGARFELDLPVWRGPGTPSVPREESPHPDRRPARVLVVDDDRDVRQLVAQLLRTLGDQVVDCAGGGEALQAIAAAPFDVALIDLGMSQMSGDQLAGDLRRQDPALALVLMTGWELDADDPRRAPFDLELRKPFADVSAVKQVLAAAVTLRDRRAAPPA